MQKKILESEGRYKEAPKVKDYWEEKLRAREEFAAQGDYLDFEEPLNERVVRNGEEVANLVRRVQTWYKARDYFVA